MAISTNSAQNPKAIVAWVRVMCRALVSLLIEIKQPIAQATRLEMRVRVRRMPLPMRPCLILIAALSAALSPPATSQAYGPECRQSGGGTTCTGWVNRGWEYGWSSYCPSPKSYINQQPTLDLLIQDYVRDKNDDFLRCCLASGGSNCPTALYVAGSCSESPKCYAGN